MAAQVSKSDSNAGCVSRPLDVARIRDDFAILQQNVHQDQRLVYLDNAASSQRPEAVLNAMDAAYRSSYANVHRGIHFLSEQATELYESARDTVRQFLNAASSKEVIFTSGATAGVNLVARAWGDANIAAGDEILLTIAEHHSNIVPWQQLAERTGCRIRFAPLNDQEALDAEACRQMMNERTRLVALTAASNVLGDITPLPEIVQAARGVGAAILVDAAQTTPHETLDVQTLGADFVVFSGHKMLGPTGIGVLWGRQEILESMPPFLGGGSMIKSVTTSGFTPARLPERFEAGTPPIVEAIGLAAAMDYLSELGLQNVQSHQEKMARAAREALAGFPGVRMLGPDAGRHSGLVSFTMTDVHPQDLAHLLDRCGVAVRAGHHCTLPLHESLGLSASTRASFYVYNDLDDIARLMEGLELVKRTLAR